MPKYEFYCEGCGATRMVESSVVDRDVPQYCVCFTKMKRVIKPPQIQFKGEGFTGAGKSPRKE